MEYPLQDAESALKWYRTQAQLYRPMSLAFLQSGGIAPGMHVLDVGSGAGDLSILLGQLVGPHGSVLGIDQSAEAIAQARSRISSLGADNIRFLQEDASRVSLDANFDAVVGQFILMYFKNASAVLHTLAGCAKPGGVIIFIEPDHSGIRSSENLPLCQSTQSLIEKALQSAGADTRMGLKLHHVFIEAGLSRPKLQLAAAIGGGPEFGGYEVAAGFVGLLLPLIEKARLGNARDIDVPTLEARLRTEVVESGGVIIFPSLISAHARVGSSKIP